MPIRDLIDTNCVALNESATISSATQHLLAHKRSSLPVTDSNGCYLGMFSMHRLLSLLLPKAVLIDGGVSDLGFVSDPMEILSERMREHGARQIGDVLEKRAPVAYPDTPLLEVVLHLYRGENDIPIVEKDSNKFLGMLAGSILLDKVCKGN